MRLVLFFLAFAAFSSFAQTDTTAQLKITGSARIKVTPDIGILYIAVSEVQATMSEAVVALGDKSADYLKTLTGLGFSAEDVKTTSFGVRTNEVRRDGVAVDSGYVASQRVRLSFPNDTVVLSKILTAFTQNTEGAEFTFAFELSDTLKASVQAQIIDYAIEDAMRKAERISTTAGLRLAGIKQIEYGPKDDYFGMQELSQEQQYFAVGAAAFEGGGFNFNPTDLVFRDIVQVEWWISE